MGILGKDASNIQIFDFWLRLFVIPFNIATIWIAVTDEQDNADYGKLEFKSLTGLKYMVCLSAISAGYVVFSAVCSWLSCLLTKPWIFFVADQLLAYLMVTSMAAQAEFLYLAYNGDKTVTWSEACVSYGNFCSRFRTALCLHVVGVCCFLAFAVISAYRVFRRFDPPFVPSKDDQQHDDERT